jgi:hypothetical protein
MPSQTPLAYPLINGRTYSFSSLEIWAGRVPIPQVAFKSINYTDKLTPGVMRGTSPHKLARTRGEHDPTGDCEIYRLAFENLKLTLGVGGIGFMETEFLILVQYADTGMPVIRDSLVGIRITEVAASNQSGTDPTAVKLTLDPMSILWNGVPGVSPLPVGFSG